MRHDSLFAVFPCPGNRSNIRIAQERLAEPLHAMAHVLPDGRVRPIVVISIGIQHLADGILLFGMPPLSINVLIT